MSYRLTNTKDPTKTLGLTPETWFGILELAEEYGWNPLGTVEPHWYLSSAYRISLASDYAMEEERLVLLEDALNLAEALDRAFIDYEPIRNGSLLDKAISSPFVPFYRRQPSIGAILKTIELCQEGEFVIEQV